MTVAELLARVSARELSEWQAYYTLEPWGEERDDLRAGIIASVVANVHRSKGGKTWKPSDFVLEFQPREREPQTEEQMMQMARLLNAAFGGEERERGDNRQPSG